MKVGLVLSGGGSRGFAHLGALKAINEAGIKPTVISGSSIGSLIGALVAQGYSPEFLYSVLSEITISKAIRLKVDKYGLLSLDPILSLIDNYIPHNSFQKLEIPLFVTATNINSSQTIHFNSGNLKQSILASCSIPGIFKPVKIEDQLFIDGGVSNNLPIEPIANLCTKIIAVNVMPKATSSHAGSFKSVLMKSLFIAIANQSANKADSIDLLIEPQRISNFNGLSTKGIDLMYKTGYETTLKLLETRYNEFI